MMDLDLIRNSCLVEPRTHNLDYVFLKNAYSIFFLFSMFCATILHTVVIFRE